MLPARGPLRLCVSGRPALCPRKVVTALAKMPEQALGPLLLRLRMIGIEALVTEPFKEPGALRVNERRDRFRVSPSGDTPEALCDPGPDQPPSV